MINYGIVYGLCDYGLADRLDIPREEAKEIIDTLPRALPEGAGVHRGDDRAGRRRDGHVTTLWGRRRQIPELKARNWQVRTLGERLAVNTVIQGTAADVMKLAIVRVAAALGDAPATRLILTVHDELLFEGPPDEVDAARELIRARDVRRRGSTTRRSPSTSASGRRGWRRSRDRGLAVVLTAAVGGLVALQAPINSALGQAVGTCQAAFLSFAIGTAALAVSPRSRRAASASRRGPRRRLVLPHRRPARRDLRHVRPRDGAHARRRRRRRRDDRRPARDGRGRRPLRLARHGALAGDAREDRGRRDAPAHSATGACVTTFCKFKTMQASR